MKERFNHNIYNIEEPICWNCGKRTEKEMEFCEECRKWYAKIVKMDTILWGVILVGIAETINLAIIKGIVMKIFAKIVCKVKNDNLLKLWWEIKRE